MTTKTYETTLAGCVALACDIERAKNGVTTAYEKYESGISSAWDEYQTCERTRWTLTSAFFGPMADIWKDLVGPEVVERLEKHLQKVAAEDGITRIEESIWWEEDKQTWDNLLDAILRCAVSLEEVDEEIPAL